MHPVEQRLRTFLVNNFFVEDSELETGASLVGTGVLDSTGILELMLFLEDCFGIRVPDEDAVPANLDTLANLVAYVERHQTAVLA